MSWSARGAHAVCHTAVPAAQTTLTVPLSQRYHLLQEVVAQGLSNFVISDDLQQELLHHCCICHQWVVNSRAVKTHHQKTHAIPAETLKAVHHRCQSFGSLITAPCHFCGGTVNKSNRPRHAGTCTALYQLVLSTLKMQVMFFDPEEKEVFGPVTSNPQQGGRQASKAARTRKGISVQPRRADQLPKARDTRSRSQEPSLGPAKTGGRRISPNRTGS